MSPPPRWRPLSPPAPAHNACVTRLEEFKSALERDVLEAAPHALGMILRLGDLTAQIVEVEAYRADDPGCHAFGRSQMKNMALFGAPGTAYVYFNYGVHWMLNVVAHESGDPAALLIRAARPLSGLDEMRSRRPKARRDEDLLSGPGKLTAAFGIDAASNGVDLLSGSSLQIEPGAPATRIAAGRRIGLAVGKGEDLPWRFVDLEEARWLSKPPG